MRYPYVRLRYRKYSVKGILISKAELKHTNDKVIITIYIYNRQKKYFLNKIKNLKSLDLYKKSKNTTFGRAFLKLKIIKSKCLYITRKVIRQRKILLKTLNLNNKFHNIENIIKNSYENNYEKKYLNNYLIKNLHREVLYIYIKQNLFFNKSKFKYNYILPLTNLIKNFYPNKKVEFNLVNLKYLYLNSYILTQTVVTKLRNRRNILIRVLIAALMMFKLPVINKLVFNNDIENKKIKTQNLTINSLLRNRFLFNSKTLNNDNLDLILNNIYNTNLLMKKLPDKNQTKYVTNNVLSIVKYKSVTGIRIEGAGRLTRRFIAQRAVFKKRYIGNLKNIDSSLKGLSSVTFRGYAKSNLQYTLLKSRIRMGSYGIKG